MNQVKYINKSTIFGTAARPRVCVFRSNRLIYVQLIDDENSKTLLAASSKSINDKQKPVEVAKLVGEALAKNAKAKKISKVVFDRNGYRYHGRVKALAEGMRQGGMEF